jgi:hypothetical protein
MKSKIPVDNSSFRMVYLKLTVDIGAVGFDKKKHRGRQVIEVL